MVMRFQSPQVYIGPILWIHCLHIVLLISEYFEKSEVEFSRFYCVTSIEALVLRIIKNQFIDRYM